MKQKNLDQFQVFFNFMTVLLTTVIFVKLLGSLKLLKILITIPMASAEAERCFSTLKRIKNFLRNMMSQERLSALAMLSKERDLIESIPDFNQRVIEMFAAAKYRRIDFLSK